MNRRALLALFAGSAVAPMLPAVPVAAEAVPGHGVWMMGSSDVQHLSAEAHASFAKDLRHFVVQYGEVQSVGMRLFWA